MATFTGTAGSDTIAGTTGDDLIEGLGGFDQLSGAAGNDTINGGADSDFISGGLGDDLMDGGDGGDSVSDFDGGSDTLRGGAGADFINVSHFGSSTASEAVAIEAGADNDQVSFNSIARGTATIDLGDGADRLSLGTVANAALTVATGAGRDTVVLQQFANFGAAPVFTDFTTGDAGDVFDLSEFVARNASGLGTSNPFGAGGYLRLVQSDGAVLLQFDRDGAGGTMSAFATLARFENTVVAAFTAANFGGYAPDGSAVQGETITGGAGSDNLSGTVGGDLISGLGGFDFIDGRNGNDTIDGGADSDNIQGGFGDDLIDGGDGNDFIGDNGGGSDTLRGGAGNDDISVSHSSSGPGAAAETIRIEGGAGDDRVGYFVFAPGSGTIDLGDGADRLQLGNGQGQVRATLGAGRDRLELSPFAAQNAIPVIADFAGGAEGDNVEIGINFTSGFQGWDGSNPFGASGYLRLVQAGADTLFQIDRDGAAGRNSGFQTLARLEGVGAATLTADNFSGFAPSFVDAADLATAVVVAPALVTEGADRSFSLGLTLKNVSSVQTSVTVAFVADQSTAGNGADVQVGGFSGFFNITQSPAGEYRIDLGRVAVLDDALVEADETVAIRVTATGQVFENGTDSVVVRVALRSDDTAGTPGADVLTGTAGGDVLRGLAGNDALSGLGGRDLIDGGIGNDTLTGGADGDAFLFVGRAQGKDRIEDFGADDVLVSTLRLADKDGDGRIAFGSDRDLDFAGGGQAVITTDAGARLTALEYDGSFAADGVTYYVYSRIGSAAGVADADLLI